MARLDRLGPAAKEVAQIGAVLGREFAYELIEPVAQRPETELQAALDRLSEAGLLFCRGTAPHSSYLFKHALVQDAAYGTLLRGRRQELHAPRRGGAGAAFRRSRRAPARTPGPSSDRCRRYRARGRSMAEGRPTCRRALGASRSDRAISSAVSRYWRRCPKGRLGTDGRSSCNWPEACRCSRPKGSSRPRRPRPIPAPASLAEQRGDAAPAVHGGLRPLAIGQSVPA